MTCYYTENQVFGGVTKWDMSLNKTCFCLQLHIWYINPCGSYFLGIGKWLALQRFEWFPLVVFGHCTCKWGIFTLIELTEQSHSHVTWLFKGIDARNRCNPYGDIGIGMNFMLLLLLLLQCMHEKSLGKQIKPATKLLCSTVTHCIHQWLKPPCWVLRLTILKISQPIFWNYCIFVNKGTSRFVIFLFKLDGSFKTAIHFNKKLR